MHITIYISDWVTNYLRSSFRTWLVGLSTELSYNNMSFVLIKIRLIAWWWKHLFFNERLGVQSILCCFYSLFLFLWFICQFRFFAFIFSWYVQTGEKRIKIGKKKTSKWKKKWKTRLTNGTRVPGSPFWSRIAGPRVDRSSILAKAYQTSLRPT